MDYHAELCRAMQLLADRSDTVFMGQAVACAGTTMSSTFDGIDMGKRLEMPVAEDMQMGMATGMAIAGLLPVCVFPRWNFLLCAANQIVNHLDRLPLYSDGWYWPKVIIRTAVPSSHPFNPGPQHDDDFTDAFRKMLRTVKVVVMPEAGFIVPYYMRAAEADHSTILVEYTDAYRNARAG